MTRQAQERSRLICRSSLHDVHRDVQQRGPGVLPLHIGEPHIGVPEAVREAFVKAIRDGHSYYCDAPGILELRTAIGGRLSETHGVRVEPDLIFATPGSCQAIAAVLLSLAFEGGKVLVPEIHWPMHLQQVYLAGLQPRFHRPLQASADVREILDEAHEPGTCAIIVTSPSNPTGEVLDRATIGEIYSWAQRRGVHVISDEAYEDFVYQGERSNMMMLDFAQSPAERIVFSVHTFSKSFSLTGYRLGYVTAPNFERAELLRRVQEALLVSPSTPVQFAGMAALDERAHLDIHREYVRQTRDECVRLLAPARLLWHLPLGGWYALLDLSNAPGGVDAFCRRLIDEAGVALAPGHAFLPAGHPLAKRLARIALCQERSATVRGVQQIIDFARN
jgi:aspartate/methionine/tyrosine aminotransferase